MSFAFWLALGGGLLLFMALSGSLLSRMPVSTSMLYLLAGLVAGPVGFALAAPAVTQHAAWLEHLTEVIVLLSLFTSGMKMSVGLSDRRWYPPLRLALVSMVVTVALITAAGVVLVGLPLGAAVLLGGILAPTDPVLATSPQHAPAYMAHAVLSFSEQLDRIGEMAGVVVLGLLLWSVAWPPAALWFVPLMLVVVRPLLVAAGLAGSRISAVQRRLIAWFGICGIGSLYYLSYAVGHGLPAQHVDTLVTLTMAVVVSSIVVHGVSVTPLMARYRQRRKTL